MRLVCVALLLLPSLALAQGANLEPGPHSVGFRVIQAWDHTRSYYPKGGFVQSANGQTGKPMQLLVWYPAAASNDAPRMKFGDYIDLVAWELGTNMPKERDERWAEFLGGPLQAAMRGASANPESVLALPTTAVKDSPPASGKFPIVLNASIGGALTHSLRLEYLASHGYVVVCPSMIGTGPAWRNRGEWTPAALEDMWMDLAFAYAQTMELPFANTEKVAAIGAHTPASVLYQMATLNLDALASLEGVFVDQIKGSPHWDVRAMRIPMIDLMSNMGGADPQPLTQELRFSDRYVVRMPKTEHIDTYQISRLLDRSKNPSYGAISAYVLAFLDASLKGKSDRKTALEKPAELGISSDLMSVTHLPNLPAVPTEREILALAREGDVAKVEQLVAAAKAIDPEMRLFEAEPMSTVAMFLGRDRKVAEARKLFALTLSVHPDSAMAHKQMGIFHMFGGQSLLAKQMFTKALSLLESDRTLSDTDRTNIRREVEQFLSRLK